QNQNGFMKKLLPTCSLFGVWAALTLPGWRSLQAQIVTSDTVTVTAPDPNASEAGPDPGLFEIRRSGPTNYALSVFYQVSGTASNGIDYQSLSGPVVIPQGSLTAWIVVAPIDDAVVEGPETVVLEIAPSPLLCPAPACGYDIGSTSNARVVVADKERIGSNKPPFVQMHLSRDV